MFLTSTGDVGSHPTLEEVVDWLIHGTSAQGPSATEMNKRADVEIHFRNFVDICWPCHIDYDVIAHMETLERDVRSVE